MKVLWFSPVPIFNNIKGSGGWVNSLSIGVKHHVNIELHIAYKANCKTIKRININGIYCYKIPSEIYASSKYEKILRYIKMFLKIPFDKGIVSKYLKVVEMVKPDLIQLFGSEHDHGLILPKINIPAVIHIQCIYEIYHHKWYSGLTKEDIKKYSSLKARIFHNTFINRYYEGLTKAKQERLYYQNCNYFMGRTDWDRRFVKLKVPEATYYHCDEMIRSEFFNHKWNNKKDGKTIKIMTTIGGAIYKGLETIIETANILENNSKYNIKWYIAGLTEKTETVKICRKKYKNKFSESIILLGKINSKQMIKTMDNVNMYVHASHIENSPNSLCEAMLVGLPIIATFAGGTPSLLINKKEGILIQDGEPWSIAGAILELYENYEQAKKYGENARYRALKRHNPDKIVKNLVYIYKDILSNN